MRDTCVAELQQLEDRVVLTALAAVVDLSSSAETGGGTSSDAHLVRDDSADTPRYVGLLQGTRLFQDFVGSPDPTDTYRFALSSTRETTIELDGLTADANIYVQNANGEMIASSANADWQSEVVQESLGAGDYFVFVEAAESAESTPYSLRISVDGGTPNVTDPEGHTFATADNLGFVSTDHQVAGFVGRGDLGDVFQFDVEAESHLSFELTGLTQNIDLALHSFAGEELAASRNSLDGREQIARTLSPGAYFVSILPHRGAFSQYTLSLSFLNEAPTPPEDPVGEPSSDPLPDVPYFGSGRDWSVNFVNAPEAWEAGFTGEGVTVAVVDTGVQLDHPDLVDNLWVNTEEVPDDGIDNDGNGYVDDRFGWDFVGDDSTPNDGNNHGTHVTGTIVAANNGFGATGVAPGARVMPIRVLNDEGAGSTLDVADGIRYAVDNGAHIVNLSLGGGYSPEIFVALQYAIERNVLVVAAAGNEGADVPGYPAMHSSMLDGVLSVGAHDADQRHASFSNAVGNSGAVQVDAPGVLVYSSLIGNHYGYLSGTSMATPHAAGVAALVLSANPNLTSRELREVLTSTAAPGVVGSDGIGFVDAAAAVPQALAIGISASGNGGPSPTPIAPLDLPSVDTVYIAERPLERNSHPSRSDVGHLVQNDNALASTHREHVDVDMLIVAHALLRSGLTHEPVDELFVDGIEDLGLHTESCG